MAIRRKNHHADQPLEETRPVGLEKASAELREWIAVDLA